jgi:hypothetical protein
MKPFLHGKKSLESEPLRIPPGHQLTLPAAGLVRSASGGPNVETVKQGDKITRLVVTCSCGERIEIDCLYPAGS